MAPRKISSPDRHSNQLAFLRLRFLQQLCKELLSYRKDTQVLNIADGSSKASVSLASGMVKLIGKPVGGVDRTPQYIGEWFPRYTALFLEEAFRRLNHLRPGSWRWSVSQAKVGIAAFDQYEHLAQLQKVLEKYPELKATLGGDYLITPDIVVSRQPVDDDQINLNGSFVGGTEKIASYTPLRLANSTHPILHASLSCKWTMRSDRSQNTRTEALNLIRNRKGVTPHIIVVTCEPLPARLASIAMGTGDIDCTYHVALHELVQAAEESSYEDQAQLLRELISGRRIRDISDLPFDLAT